MNGDTTTGPVFFGRWSQPAALTNAGLIPRDLYPLEKILFCAGCGQQFIGTHRTGTGIEDSTHATGSAHGPGGVHQPSGTPVNGGVRVTGTHLTSTHLTSTHATGGTFLVGPDDFPDGDEYAEDPRVYGTFCDCRPRPLEAFRVELEVYSETHLHAFDTPEPVPGLTKAHYALLAKRFFTRVEVGPTADHMTFTPRI